MVTVLYFRTPPANGRHVYGRVCDFRFRDAPEVGVENALLEVRELRKEYVTGRGRLQLFDGLSFTVRKGRAAGDRRRLRGG